MTLNEWAIQHRETLIDNPYLLGYLSERYTSDQIVAISADELMIHSRSIGYAGYAFVASFADLKTALRETKTGSLIITVAETLSKVKR